jgi:hypothetical protein
MEVRKAVQARPALRAKFGPAQFSFAKLWECDASLRRFRARLYNASWV